MYLVLTEEFLKGEVAGITDEAYNELHTDLLKKLMFMIDSFFKQHEIDFTTLSKQKAYTGFLGKIWFKIQIEIIDEASKDYLLHFDCYYGKEVFDNFFDLINHLKAILEK